MVNPAEAVARLRSSPQLVCLARTFAKHAAELGNPVPPHPIFFLKSPSSMIRSSEPIRLSKSMGTVHHEGEIAVVLAKGLNRSNPQEAESAIAGYTVLNDVTERSVQSIEDGRFSRAKSYPSFCPISDELITDVHWSKLSVECFVNGQLKQRGKLTDMTKTPPELLSWISEHLDLRAGDVVALGTPDGVGPLCLGDQLETRLLLDERCVISLKNPVLEG